MQNFFSELPQVERGVYKFEFIGALPLFLSASCLVFICATAFAANSVKKVIVSDINSISKRWLRKSNKTSITAQFVDQIQNSPTNQDCYFPAYNLQHILYQNVRNMQSVIIKWTTIFVACYIEHLIIRKLICDVIREFSLFF